MSKGCISAHDTYNSFSLTRSRGAVLSSPTTMSMDIRWGFTSIQQNWMFKAMLQAHMSICPSSGIFPLYFCIIREIMLYSKLKYLKWDSLLSLPKIKSRVVWLQCVFIQERENIVLGKKNKKWWQEDEAKGKMAGSNIFKTQRITNSWTMLMKELLAFKSRSNSLLVDVL